MRWLFSLELLIRFIFVLGWMKIITPESISSQTWSNKIQDLSLKVHQGKIMESHPLMEGFMLLSDDLKRSSPASARSKPPQVLFSNRTFESYGISSTTVIVTTTKKQLPPLIDHSVGHLGRRLLNEPSYDTDHESPSKQISFADDWASDDLMRVDPEELSKQLLRFEPTMYGSGDTTEETTEQTPMTTATSGVPTSSPTTPLTTTATEQPILSNKTTFIMTLTCSNWNATLSEILDELEEKFGPYAPGNITESECDDLENVNITFEVTTDNTIGLQTNLFANLSEIAKERNVDLYSDDKCGNDGIRPVINVTSCFLINLCQFCGANPTRGICLPEYKVAKCECLPNRNDPSRPFSGEFCLPSNAQPVTSPSIPSRWTPVIVGILAGLTGLFCVITSCLWAIAVCRPHTPKYDFRVRRLWHLPRAEIPTSVTTENVPNNLDNSPSASSSRETDSEDTRSNTSDSTFFKELDQKMGENLRATIARPNTSAMLASLPLDTVPSLSNYDPIDELDSIIDNEDIDTIFHDPLNELYEENEIVEAINPSVTLA